MLAVLYAEHPVNRSMPKDTDGVVEGRTMPMLRSFSPKSSRPGYWNDTSFSWISGGGSSVGSGNSKCTCSVNQDPRAFSD
jgi:hypothetical protein